MKSRVSKLIALDPDPDPDPDGYNDGDISCRPMSPLEAASFIESMAAELRAIARSTKLGALSYFLEMARIEASAEIERLASPSSERH